MDIRPVFEQPARLPVAEAALVTGGHRANRAVSGG
jgi:hypothetical protein